MSKTINIIADIAGRFDELTRLLDKMPKADLILSVGDMMDRGSQSREVLEWFMGKGWTPGEPKRLALYGNHEDLMWQTCMYGDAVPGAKHTWLMNGGKATLANFTHTGDLKHAYVEAAILDYLAGLPLYYEQKGLFVSHAPVPSPRAIPKDPYARDEQAIRFIWNRMPPWEANFEGDQRFYIYGHNAVWFEHVNTKTGEPFAWCIDNSSERELTGVHWPTRDIYRQEYLK